METIAAIATALSPAGIAIIRLSGHDSAAIAARLFHAATPLADSPARTMILGTFSYGGFFERCLAVRFPAPNSYTGEDVVEFQVHGGVRVAQNVLDVCLSNGARLAEAGEFTKRAFLNGKLTLAQAEGTIDTINAASDAELRAGYALVSGAISKKIEELRTAIIDITSAIEVVIDYPEEDLETVTHAETSERVNAVLADIDRLLASARTGMIVRDGLNVAILGKPNVGKSSLLNALLGVRRAIVTDIAGTTRDYLIESIVHRGVKFNLIDTAGLRDSTDAAETAGIEDARRIASSCDIAVIIIDSTFNSDDRAIIDSVKGAKLLVSNKSDLGDCPPSDLSVSAKSGEGLDRLKDKLFSLYVDESLLAGGEMITSARHADALRAARAALCRALDAPTLEVVPTDLRDALIQLGKIDGSTVSESVTNDIFSKFCLGK